MTKATRQKKLITHASKKSATARRRSTTLSRGRFDEVLALIDAARRRAYQAVNTELIGLYWKLGEYQQEDCDG